MLPDNLEYGIEDLTRQAVQVGRERFGVSLDFSMSSLSQVDNLLRQAAQLYKTQQFTPQGLDRTAEVWGAYIGETIRRNKGGKWQSNKNETGDRRFMLITSDGNIFPFQHVRQKIIGEAAIPDGPEIPPELEPEPLHKKANPLLVPLLIVGGLVLTIAIGISIMLALQYQEDQAATKVRTDFEAPFLLHMNEYLTEYPKTLVDAQSVSGKMIVVDKGSRSVADLYYLLPQELRAANPEEVNIVIQQICVIAEPDPSHESARQICTLTLVDMNRRFTTSVQEFEGVYSQDKGSSLDKGQMVNWLTEKFK
jgi:hypothetical protein